MKRYLLICVVLIIIVSGGVVSFAEDGDRDVWDGTTTKPTTIVEKDGVRYYAINTCEELAYIAEEGGDWLSRNYMLMCDMVLNDVKLEWDDDGELITNTESLLKWPMIGSGMQSECSGVFDSNGHTISGMVIEEENGFYVGMFECIDKIGIVRNIIISNSSIRADMGAIGGIAGRSSGSIENCVNKANINSIVCDLYTDEVGGIVGQGGGSVKNCTNYGNICGYIDVGGIAGDGGKINNCINYGNIIGRQNVGGIGGRGSRYSLCVNFGKVTCTDYNAGGILGISGQNTIIKDCYNMAVISGSKNIGGIIGSSDETDITNCYNAGDTACTDEAGENIGAIIGTDGVLWGIDRVSSCYYLQNDNVNTGIYGCGGDGIDFDPEGITAVSSNQLQTAATFSGWDFDNTWCISENRNNGYPALQWEMETDVALQGISLDSESLSIAVGDSYLLSVKPNPLNALLPELSWSSSDTSVVTVNNDGLLTALKTGFAVVTVQSGDFSAECEVTVTGRAPNEYRINSLTIKSPDGTACRIIPTGRFLATVSITNLNSNGNTMVMLACYSEDGQYEGLLWVSIEGMKKGSTVKVTLPVDNSSGEISVLKAFTVSSFTNMEPLGEGVTFPAS